MDKKRIVLMASGTGSLAQAVIDAVNEERLHVIIAELICDKPEAPVIARAEAAGIPIFVHPMQKNRQNWSAELIAQIASISPDLVVSVGFMRILPPEFVSRFATINSHPSLLPNFPGAHAVSDALNAGVERTGTTVHWVDEGVDTGKIIAQVEVPVLSTDDEAILHERIKIAERNLIVKTIQELLPTLDSATEPLEK